MRSYGALLAILSVVLLALVACTEVSPALGRFKSGRTLVVGVMEMRRTSEVRYNTGTSDQGPGDHYRIVPSSEDLELLMLRISVQNHTATSAIVNLDEQAAELRDYTRGRYPPVNVVDRAEQVSAPANPRDEQQLLFLWNSAQADGSTRAIDLPQGYGVEGWMLFEIPKKTRMRELRWRAGDSLTIEFWPS